MVVVIQASGEPAAIIIAQKPVQLATVGLLLIALSALLTRTGILDLDVSVTMVITVHSVLWKKTMFVILNVMGDVKVPMILIAIHVYVMPARIYTENVCVILTTQKMIVHCTWNQVVMSVIPIAHHASDPVLKTAQIVQQTVQKILLGTVLATRTGQDKIVQYILDLVILAVLTREDALDLLRVTV